MAAENFIFNVSKGRFGEFWHRVQKGDPASCQILLIPVTVSGTQTARQDDDTVTQATAVLVEQTAGGWTRGTLTSTQLTQGSVYIDDANNVVAGTIPSFTWTSPAATNNTTGLLVAYGTSGATDSTRVPISHHAFAVTADGNNVVLNAGTIITAS